MLVRGNIGLPLTSSGNHSGEPFCKLVFRRNAFNADAVSIKVSTNLAIGECGPDRSRIELERNSRSARHTLFLIVALSSMIPWWYQARLRARSKTILMVHV